MINEIRAWTRAYVEIDSTADPRRAEAVREAVILSLIAAGLDSNEVADFVRAMLLAAVKHGVIVPLLAIDTAATGEDKWARDFDYRVTTKNGMIPKDNDLVRSPVLREQDRNWLDVEPTDDGDECTFYSYFYTKKGATYYQAFQHLTLANRDSSLVHEKAKDIVALRALYEKSNGRPVKRAKEVVA